MLRLLIAGMALISGAGAAFAEGTCEPVSKTTYDEAVELMNEKSSNFKAYRDCLELHPGLALQSLKGNKNNICDKLDEADFNLYAIHLQRFLRKVSCLEEKVYNSEDFEITKYANPTGGYMEISWEDGSIHSVTQVGLR